MLEMHVARPSELAGARAVWQQSFGDSDACVNLTFDEILSWGTLLVLTVDEIVCGAVSILPCETRSEEGAVWKTGYIYGLCVRSEDRRKGYASGLVQYADYYMESHGCACGVVVPAEPWMAKLYRTAYFGDCFTLKKTERAASDLPEPAPDALAQPVSDADYAMLREELLKGTVHVAYPAAYLAFQRKLSALCPNGGFFRVQAGGEAGCACADLQPDGTCLVHELLFPGDADAALAALARVLPAARYLVRTPDAQGESFGLLRHYVQDTAINWKWNRTRGFLGLALD